MKRVFCLIIALLVCSSLVLPVLAAEDTFVPSISYKDGPDVENATMNGEDVTDCIVVTSINQAEDKSTDITQEERYLLLEVYERLLGNPEDIGLEEGQVIRELVDVSFEYEDCRNQEDHNVKDGELKKPGQTISIVFDLGVAEDTDVIVKVYVDDQWKDAESVTNNGDGTVTVVFEDICPVAFIVDGEIYDVPPQTGDAAGELLPLWIGLLVLSAVALVAVIIIAFRKKSR